MPSFTFVDPEIAYTLPHVFDFDGYIETERELWAFFPETQGRRVNFCQLGLTARLFAEVPENGRPLSDDETYFLMPCGDGTLRPVRMRSERILTLEEFRMSHMTSLRMIHMLAPANALLNRVHREVLGEEILDAAAQQFGN